MSMITPLLWNGGGSTYTAGVIGPVCVAKGSRQLGRGESNAGIETWGKEDDLLARRTAGPGRRAPRTPRQATLKLPNRSAQLQRPRRADLRCVTALQIHAADFIGGLLVVILMAGFRALLQQQDVNRVHLPKRAKILQTGLSGAAKTMDLLYVLMIPIKRLRTTRMCRKWILALSRGFRSPILRFEGIWRNEFFHACRASLRKSRKSSEAL